MEKILKWRIPGRDIKSYEEFIKLNPKNIYIEEDTEEYRDLQLVEASMIRDENHFNLMANEPYTIYEVLEEYYREDVVELAEILQELIEDYNGDLSILDNADILYKKGYRITKED